MIMFTVGYIFVWLKRPIEKTYLWLGLSCASAIGFLLPLGVSFPMDGYREWRMLQTGSLSTYVLFMLMFIRSYLGLTKSSLEKLHVVGLVVSLAVIPIQYVYTTSLLVSFIVIASALFIVVLFWQFRVRVGTSGFLIFFPTCLLALTFAFDALLLWLSGLPPRSLHLLQAMPLLSSIVCLWLVLLQLVKSLSDTERMTSTLQETIAAKSKELETSYAKLAQVDRETAVNKERRRIMLDLHDGIGGQLVSTLAYMENKDVGDDTLRMALEDALRDLALMLDSIENDDSLTMLLGMLRTRLEGLLADHGAHIDWQVEDEPVLLKPSPSVNLHVARVVQEAIRNVIKRAQASRITIKTDHSTIMISDDGVGFDLGAAQQTSKGHGLIGMKRRAQQIGADLTIQSNETGTRVTLSL